MKFPSQISFLNAKPFHYIYIYKFIISREHARFVQLHGDECIVYTVQCIVVRGNTFSFIIYNDNTLSQLIFL